MSFTHALYQLLIGPLELIFEYVYAFAESVFHSVGLSILAVSLVVNVLLFPLYKQADAIQDEERAAQKKLSKWVKHIKSTFSGNERFMMLQTYYRQNNYKPFYALRGSLPLLLEVPFFIAAYHFLSHLDALNGASFGPITELGRPDGLLTIAGTSINVLPILMTLINLVSGAIYTKGLPIKDKLQLYGMAFLFLVLLYGSPAGLVVYWTMNNLFSLLKNLVAKISCWKKIRCYLLSAVGIAVFIYGILPREGAGWIEHSVLILAAVVMQLPLIWPYLKKKLPAAVRNADEKNASFGLFFSGCIFLALLTGLLIPSAVVLSSPAEFVFIKAYRSPLVHVLASLLLSVGLFMGWFSLFYFLAGKQTKRVMGCLVWLLSGAAIVNYMFFGTDLGTLTSELQYVAEPFFPLRQQALNLAVLAALILVLLVIWRKSQKIVRYALVVLSVVVFGMSVVNMINIRSELPALEQEAEAYQIEMAEGRQAKIRLSKEGKNVIVLMLDRAISKYVPYMFKEKPELQEQFDGFTYYPNTVSFGAFTNTGSPPLFGGYEYTPEEMNKRDTEALADKHNEALRVMPVLFDENDFDVAVMDPPYAGYRWIPDLSIYDDYPDIRAYHTEEGQFNAASTEKQAERLYGIWERNFFLYSVMKTLPLSFQPTVYQGGTYYLPNKQLQTQAAEDLSVAVGTNDTFLNSYRVLTSLTSMTEVTDQREDTFTMMVNSTTHEPVLLQTPDYEPSYEVDNREYDRAHADRFSIGEDTLRVEQSFQMMHYHVNMSAFLQLGKWFDSLRENGVYDNTRIILVSDHGRCLWQEPNLILDESRKQDVMLFNPVLLVKDFDSRGFTTDDRFMTNADVPTLAVQDLIRDPVNPFTGKKIDSEPKNKPEQHVFASDIYDISKNNGNRFIPDAWYAVHDDIFKYENWTKLGEY